MNDPIHRAKCSRSFFTFSSDFWKVTSRDGFRGFCVIAFFFVCSFLWGRTVVFVMPSVYHECLFILLSFLVMVSGCSDKYLSLNDWSVLPSQLYKSSPKSALAGLWFSTLCMYLHVLLGILVQVLCLEEDTIQWILYRCNLKTAVSLHEAVRTIASKESVRKNYFAQDVLRCITGSRFVNLCAWRSRLF